MVTKVRHRQEVTRTWQRNRVRVEARHPQHGLLLRGWVVMAGSESGRMRWTLVNYDHEPVGSPIVGDYVTAEAALLAATRELEN